MTAHLHLVPASAPPASLEAEQALLGAILYDNAAAQHLPDALSGQHFAEPFHGWLYDQAAGLIAQGRAAEPIDLDERAKRLPAYAGLGGVRYLADLIDRAPPAAMAGHFAGVVLDLALRRDLIRVAGEAAAAAREDRETPARDHLESAEQQLFALAETKAATGFVPFAANLAGAVAMAAEAFRRDGGLSGLATGFYDLDRKLGGLHPGDLVVLAGRPSMGKTALATTIAFEAARAGEPTAFFSLEMSGEQLALRLLAAEAGVASDRLRRGAVSPEDFGAVRQAAMAIESAPLHIDATGGLALPKLCARARRLKRTSGLGLVVVDYLQLVSPGPTRRERNRVAEVSEITQGLKALAKELRTPVIALSQLSRAVEGRDDKRPQLADLRESGAIEQDADVVMFVYREEYYLGRAEPKPGTVEHQAWLSAMDAARGRADLIIAKQRHGPIGTVKLAFDAALTRFTGAAAPEPGAVRTPYRDD